MQRVILFAVGGAVVVLIAAGVFMLGQQPAIAPDELPRRDAAIPESELRDPDEIIIEGNRFTDTRQGYSGIIPENSQIEKPTAKNLSTKFFDDATGCKYSSGFLPTTKGPAELIHDIEDDLVYQTVNQFTVSDFALNGKPAKRVILDTLEQDYSEAVYAETEKGTFQATLFIYGENTVECIGNFNSFLGTIKFSD